MGDPNVKDTSTFQIGQGFVDQGTCDTVVDTPVETHAVSDDGPISRDELLRRGLTVELDESVADSLTKLGFFGERQTHELREIIPAPAADETPGAALQRVGADPYAWAADFMDTACYNEPLGRSLRQFPHGDRTELHDVMAGWFANAIGAGMQQERLRWDPVLRQMYRNEGKADKLPSPGYGLVDGSGLDGVRFVRRRIEVEAVEFQRIEFTATGGRAVFNRGDLPEWLVECFAQAEGSDGALWVSGGALLLSDGISCWPILPGTWIVRDSEGHVTSYQAEAFSLAFQPVEADPTQ
jgi:hypothetical protein